MLRFGRDCGAPVVAGAPPAAHPPERAASLPAPRPCGVTTACVRRYRDEL